MLPLKLLHFSWLTKGVEDIVHAANGYLNVQEISCCYGTKSVTLSPCVKHMQKERELERGSAGFVRNSEMDGFLGCLMTHFRLHRLCSNKQVGKMIKNGK
jgi:hypothetical protein